MIQIIVASLFLSFAYGQTTDPSIQCNNLNNLPTAGGTASFQVLCNQTLIGTGTAAALAQDNLCSQHCQCAHNTTWGQCQTRTASQLQGTYGLGDQYCQCHNSTGSCGQFKYNCSEPTNAATALTWVQGPCSLQSGPHTGGCNDICYCSLGVQYGWCDTKGPLGTPTKCTCTNDTSTIPSNAYFNPLLAMG